MSYRIDRMAREFATILKPHEIEHLFHLISEQQLDIRLLGLCLSHELLRSRLAESESDRQRLDANWDNIHVAAMTPIRQAIGNPNATVPEIVDAIERLKPTPRERHPDLRIVDPAESTETP